MCGQLNLTLLPIDVGSLHWALCIDRYPLHTWLFAASITAHLEEEKILDIDMF